MKVYEFDGVIKEHSTKGESLVEFPYDVKEEFGDKDRVKVMVAFDNLEFRSWITKNDYPTYYIGLTKRMREEIGKNTGGKVHVTLSHYEDQKTGKVYDELVKALENNRSAQKHFDSLSHSQQMEYVRWVKDAKKPVTVERRLEEVIELIRGKKLPSAKNS
jgi:hypothetical protein